MDLLQSKQIHWVLTQNDLPVKHLVYIMKTKIESSVKKQSILLEKVMPDLLKQYSTGKFVAFFNGATLVEDTHEACFDKAEKAFGDQGFVISEITQQPLFVSSIIKF